jgi:putative ABC transport system permease protein
MSILAWRNLIHDKVRLAVTLTGIVFAVVLIVVEFGLFLGFMTTTSSLIDQSGADLWIIAERVPYIELGIPFSERKLSAVLATPGVAEARKYVARFTQWQRPDGRQENVQVAGFNLDGTLGRPWNVVAGTIHDLEAPDAIFVDELYREKLGVTRIGQVVEIRGHRARVVGFTRGIRAFTTAPYIFTSFKNAQNYASLREDQTLKASRSKTSGEHSRRG